jgi:hypothetical protein
MELNADPSLDDTKSKPIKNWFENFQMNIGPKFRFPNTCFVFLYSRSNFERLRLSYQSKKRKIRDGIDFKISVFF